MVDKPSTGATLDTGHALATSLALAYLFNEGSGTTVTDYSGNGHTGTASLTALSWTTSLYFTGANAFAMASAATATANTLSIAGFSAQNAPWTIALWLRNAGSDTFGTLLSQASAKGLWSHNSGSGYKLDYEESGAHESTTVLAHNTNYRVVIAASTSQIKFYVNTVADGTPSMSNASFSPSHVFNDTTSETFIGTIDLLYFWAGRELNSTEVGTVDASPFAMFTEPVSTGPSSRMYFF